MKYGVNTFIWAGDFGHEQLALLPVLKEKGFNGVEVPLFDPAQFLASEIRRGCDAAGLECTICSVLTEGLSLLHDDVATRAATVDHLRRCIAAAAEAGAHYVAGPLYAPVGYLPGRRRTEEEWKRAVDGYRNLTAALDEYEVTLAIEPLNRFETYFLNTAADGVRLCEAVAHSRVGLLFDTFHANIEEKDIGEALRSCGAHVKYVHTCENNRGIPGSGHVEWDAVSAALRAIGYDGWLSIESFGFSIEKLAAAAAIWRDLAPTPESIAFEGLAFLKNQRIGLA